MIAVSADWLAEEANPKRQPVFFATLYPHYFLTGVGAGSGTFVNMTFVAPGRLQVDVGAGLASWNSPVLTAGVADYPTSITPVFSLDYPGYDCAVEYRTASSEAALASAAWLPLVSGTPVSSQRYYEWRISFVSIRSWAYDTEEEAAAHGDAAYALDAADPEDPYESFAVDSAAGTIAFIENVKFAGIFEIDPADVIDWGSLTEEFSIVPGELVAGDYTITLANRDYKYSRTHPKFILTNDSRPEKKKLLIEMAYRKQDGTLTERHPLYLGIVDEWGPAPGGSKDNSGEMAGRTATISTLNLIAAIQDLKIGTPDENNKPNPLVMGEVFRQLDQVADETLGEPDAKVDFETGDTTGLAGVDSGTGGVVEVRSAAPLMNGNYYLHTGVAAAGAYAQGRLDLAVAGVEILYTGKLRFAAVPEAPADKNMHFLGLYDNSGGKIVKFFVGSDFRVYGYAAGEYKETEWYVNRDVGVSKRVSIGVSGYEYGTLKLWVEGNEVLTWDGDWRSLSIKGAFFGPNNGATAETWGLQWDDPEVSPNWWPQLYRAHGGPYESIGTVYVEGAIRVGPEPVTINQSRRNLRTGAAGVQSALVGGVAKVTGLEKWPEYGAVAFTDYSQKVGGTVAAYLRKNSIAHWVDALRAALAEHSYDQYLDEAAAAAAKAATPDDSAGYYFENMTMGDAINAMGGICLFSFFQTADTLKIKAYTGVAADSYVMEITAAMLQTWAPKVYDKEIKNKQTVKYGRYASNPDLCKKARDDASIADLGTLDGEIDMSWAGGCVGTDNGDMAQRKADAKLCRDLRGRLEDNQTSTLKLAHLQAGDNVLINLPDREPVIMEINKKKGNLMAPKGTEFMLNKFLGEQAA